MATATAKVRWSVLGWRLIVGCGGDWSDTCGLGKAAVSKGMAVRREGQAWFVNVAGSVVNVAMLDLLD